MLSSRDVLQDPRRLRQLARTPAVYLRTAGRDRTRQRVVVLVLLIVVVALDQSVKWWAWRDVAWARINSGGDALVGQTVGAWYAGRVTGALLDVLDFGLLSVAAWGLTRCRATATVVVPGALMTGGWISNLLDRLGIHDWTAPGSVRGVVDFMHIGAHYYNIADFFIIGCTPIFLLAAGYQGVRAARRLIAAASVSPVRSQERARIPGALYRESGPRTEQALRWPVSPHADEPPRSRARSLGDIVQERGSRNAVREGTVG
jgi:lipoprotein signal peptidase